MSDQETPVESFKRATAACLRAMSDEGELEVTPAYDQASISGNGKRSLPRAISIRQKSLAFEEADGLALAPPPRPDAMPGVCPHPRPRVTSSRRWSRRGSRQSAPAICRALRTISGSLSKISTRKRASSGSPTRTTCRSTT